MKYIRKINENTESFLDFIKHETYVLNDFVGEDVINGLQYLERYFNTTPDITSREIKNDNYNIKGVRIFFNVYQKPINLSNYKRLIDELCRIEEKLKYDRIQFIVSFYTTNSSEQEKLHAYIKIYKENE